MAEDEPQLESNLRQLGQRLRTGMADRHPVPEKRLEAVRELARKRWAQEQEQRAGGTKSQGNEARDAKQGKPAQEQIKPAPKSKDKDWGHSY